MKIVAPVSCVAFDLKHSKDKTVDDMYAISTHDTKEKIESDIRKLHEHEGYEYKNSINHTCTLTNEQYFRIIEPLFAQVHNHNRELLAKSIKFTKDPKDGYWYTDSRNHRVYKKESGSGYILQVYKRTWDGTWRYINICSCRTLKAAQFTIVKRCVIPNTEILRGV